MKKRAISAMLAVATVAAMSFTGCGNNAANTNTSSQAQTNTASSVEASVSKDAAVAAPGDAAGFEEIPIFEDEELGFINLSAVYFQPVPMQSETQNISAEDFDLHLEADISALENNLGYGVGDWVPYLTVDYDVIGSDGKSAASGTFMTMAASDGPHYGANVKLPNADTYSLKITIKSPGENGYLIHSDSETGPGGLLTDVQWPLTYTFEGWDYVPQEW
ncbi:MAG: iron transporter [Lachnospiraceae bacterium]|nr:iron transporter [Lachnospiraceae bacterium]